MTRWVCLDRPWGKLSQDGQSQNRISLFGNAKTSFSKSGVAIGPAAA